jgi:hypothetical protein
MVVVEGRMPADEVDDEGPGLHAPARARTAIAANRGLTATLCV